MSLRENTVKVVCPHCHGHKRECEAFHGDIPPGQTIMGWKNPFDTPVRLDTDAIWCEGKGYIWATVWQER